VAGAPLVPWFTVARSALVFTAGSPVLRQSSTGVMRGHCAACGTPLTYENTDWLPSDEETTIDITTCSLDQPGEIAPDAQIWSEDDLPWMCRLSQLPLYRRLRSEGLLRVPEAGGPPDLELRQVSFAAARESLLAVRVPVFVQEQGVPLALEEDDRDPHCLHLLASVAGRPVAAARLDVGQGGKIGRVAVVRDMRGSGVGRALMLCLHRLAAGNGLDSLWCHAQLSAVRFYEKLGYLREGETFLEAGIPHQTLRYRLKLDSG
jgi:predicted GNAT family N-acyltransferase